MFHRFHAGLRLFATGGEIQLHLAFLSRATHHFFRGVPWNDNGVDVMKILEILCVADEI